MNNGKVFCTLTYSKIQSITGFSLEKIRKMKEDLRKKHLITYESGGFSKADRFYVHLPQISKNMEITDSNTWNHLKKKPIEIKYRNEKIIFDINHNPKIKGYKLRYDAEVTQTKYWKSHKRNIGSNINEILEVTQTKSNKTYIIKTYFNNLYINKTTTKPQKQKHCGNCGNDKNNIIFKIKDEYQIHKLTKTYERKIQDFSNIFSLDIIHYAIEYAGEKAVTSPTNLLLTILSNWKQAGVQTLEQAKGQENNYRKGHDTGNTSSEVKSIEKTPQWLLDKQNEKNNDKDQDEMSEEEKIAFEKEREALLKEIESFWT